MRRERDESHQTGEYNVLEIHLNANLNAQSLDEMETNRKKVCHDYAKNLNLESKQLLAMCPKDCITGQPAITVEDIARQGKMLEERVTKERADTFNDTTSFKQKIDSLSHAWIVAMEEQVLKLARSARSEFAVLQKGNNHADERGKSQASYFNIYKLLTMAVKILQRTRTSTSDGMLMDLYRLFAQVDQHVDKADMMRTREDALSIALINEGKGDVFLRESEHLQGNLASGMKAAGEESAQSLRESLSGYLEALRIYKMEVVALRKKAAAQRPEIDGVQGSLEASAHQNHGELVKYTETTDILKMMFAVGKVLEVRCRGSDSAENARDEPRAEILKKAISGLKKAISGAHDTCQYGLFSEEEDLGSLDVSKVPLLISSSDFENSFGYLYVSLLMAHEMQQQGATVRSNDDGAKLQLQAEILERIAMLLHGNPNKSAALKQCLTLGEPPYPELYFLCERKDADSDGVDTCTFIDRHVE
jgi:hypothetical protein